LAVPRVLQPKSRPAPPPRHGAVVQRYTQEGEFLISEHREMAIKAQGGQAKEFYASERLLSESNRNLDALGSPIVLMPTGEASGPLKGLFKVVPQRRDLKPKLLNSDKCVDVGGVVAGASLDKLIYGTGHQLYSRDLAYEGVGAKPLARFLDENIGGNAQQLNDFFSGGGERRYNFSLKGHRVTQLTDLKPILPEVNFRRAFCLTMRDSVEQEIEQDFVDAVTRMFPSEVMNITVSDKRDDDIEEDYTSKLEKIVAEVTRSRENAISERYQISATGHENLGEHIGVNRSANPKVGEAYVVFATREHVKGWPYHVATVIARDGSDKVTLENYNRRGDLYEGNENDYEQRYEQALDSWYFRMYGPKEQSFHDQWKGDVAGALTVRAAPNASIWFKEEIAEKIAKQTGQVVGEEVKEAIDRAQTRAELIKILFKATGTT
jgi:hypothetical protein